MQLLIPQLGRHVPTAPDPSKGLKVLFPSQPQEEPFNSWAPVGQAQVVVVTVVLPTIEVLELRMKEGEQREQVPFAEHYWQWAI